MYLGDSGVGQAYTDWASTVQLQGGVATTWPFSDKYAGLSAARYPSDVYAQLANTMQIDNTAPAQASAQNDYVYVLAGSDVQAASPTTMTLWQKFLNSGFTGASSAATALGLPSLADIEAFLKKWGLYLAAGGAGVLLLSELFRMRPRLNPRGRRRHHRRRAVRGRR